MSVHVHIGFPKTGTTYLQKAVFGKDRGINPLGKPWVSDALMKNTLSMFRLDAAGFETELPNLHQQFSQHYSDGKRNIFSLEGILRFTNNRYYDHIDFKTMIGRIHALFAPFGPVSYFFLIRNHTDYLYSHYNQFAKGWKRHGFTIDDLLPHLKGEISDRSFILDNFKYHQILETVGRVTGGANTKFYFYEDLKRNNTAFLRTLFADLKIDFDEHLYPHMASTFKLTANKSPGLWGKLRSLFIPQEEEKTAFVPYSFFKTQESVIKQYYREDLLRFSDDAVVQKLNEYNYL